MGGFVLLAFQRGSGVANGGYRSVSRPVYDRLHVDAYPAVHSSRCCLGFQKATGKGDKVLFECDLS